MNSPVRDTNNPEAPPEHRVRQEIPWPPFPEARHNLTKWVCKCGWESLTVTDKRGDPVLELARRQATRHEAAPSSVPAVPNPTEGRWKCREACPGGHSHALATCETESLPASSDLCATPGCGHRRDEHAGTPAHCFARRGPKQRLADNCLGFSESPAVPTPTEEVPVYVRGAHGIDYSNTTPSAVPEATGPKIGGTVEQHAERADKWLDRTQQRTAELGEALDVLAHIVSQANVNAIVDNADDAIVRYDMPVGSIHKAIPFLQRFGIVVDQYGAVHKGPLAPASSAVPVTERPDPAPVITLCGSTKFKDAINAENKRLTMEGNVVISLGLFGHTDLPDYNWDTDATDLKTMLDRLHFQKIDMADSVHVVNPTGYYGESTTREIEYARSQGKPVTFMVGVS